MNPYTIPLIAVTAGLTLYASFRKNKWIRRGLLLAATVAFWVILNFEVDWTFTHPFNPDDGGPRVFALMFGWAFGLILIVIPLYWISRGIQTVARKLKKKDAEAMKTNLKMMLLLAVLPVLVTGCGLGESTYEINGTEEQRVAEVERYLLKNVATVYRATTNNNSIVMTPVAQKPGVTLPGKIADPHYLYTSHDSFRHDGDQYYVSFRVPVADVDKWTAILEPRESPSRNRGELELPVPPKKWWVADDRLSRLTFYKPLPLAGHVNGWVGVDRATGEIFVYSFTM